MTAGERGEDGAAQKNEDNDTGTGLEKGFDLQPDLSCGALKAPAFKDKSTRRRGDSGARA
jgi:hypothetical protein